MRRVKLLPTLLVAAVVACRFTLAAVICDFDRSWPYEPAPCSDWSINPKTAGGTTVSRLISGSLAAKEGLHALPTIDYRPGTNESGYAVFYTTSKTLPGRSSGSAVPNGLERTTGNRLVAQTSSTSHLSANNSKSFVLQSPWYPSPNLSTCLLQFAVLCSGRIIDCSINQSPISPTEFNDIEGFLPALSISVEESTPDGGRVVVFPEVKEASTVDGLIRHRSSFYNLKNTTRAWTLLTMSIVNISSPFRLFFNATLELNGHTRTKNDSESLDPQTTYIALDSIELNHCYNDSTEVKQPVCSMNEFYCSHGDGSDVNFHNGICIERWQVCDQHVDCSSTAADERSELCETVEMAPVAECDFERDMCGWKIVNSTKRLKSNGIHSWTRTDQPIYSVAGDDTGNPGYCLYFDGAVPLVSVAIETSLFKVLPVENYDTCRVRFTYFIFGLGNRLEMFLVEWPTTSLIDGDGGGRSSSVLSARAAAKRENTPCSQQRIRHVWDSSRSIDTGQRPRWRREAVELPTDIQCNFTIRFEAINVIAHWGHIALDNFSLTPECVGRGLLSGLKPSTSSLQDAIHSEKTFFDSGFDSQLKTFFTLSVTGTVVVVVSVAVFIVTAALCVRRKARTSSKRRLISNHSLSTNPGQSDMGVDETASTNGGQLPPTFSLSESHSSLQLFQMRHVDRHRRRSHRRTAGGSSADIAPVVAVAQQSSERNQMISDDVGIVESREVIGGGNRNLMTSSTMASVPMVSNPYYEFSTSNYAMRSMCSIPRSRVNFVRLLGRGAFGNVYQGILVAEPTSGSGDTTTKPVAIKTLVPPSSAREELDFTMEAAIMSKFDHPNIVKMIGICFDTRPYYIILELLDGGDLKTFLREIRPKPNEERKVSLSDMINFALDVARGCQYLEDNHFIHRDIAARNCLLTTKSCVSRTLVKIADFGMARDVYRSEYYRKSGKSLLPVRWMPPEAFMDGLFSSKSDVWSYGVLLWEIFSFGYLPYHGRSNHEVIELVLSGGQLDAPEDCPRSVRDLMNDCWIRAPDRRVNFDNIVSRLTDCLRLADGNAKSSVHRNTSPKDDNLLMKSESAVVDFSHPCSASDVSPAASPVIDDVPVSDAVAKVTESAEEPVNEETSLVTAVTPP